MAGSWNLDRVSEAFETAALGAIAWQEAVDVLTQETDAHGTCLLPLKGATGPLAHSATLDDAYATYNRDGWVARDVRYRSLPILARDGVAVDQDFATFDEIARHPYWQEWLAPHGLQWFAGIQIGFHGMTWCLSVQRRLGQGPFTPTEKHLLKGISPHLSAAAALAYALRNARIDSALAAFGSSGTAIMLIDSFGVIVGINPVAEAMLNEDIQISRGRLTSYDRSATAGFGRAVADLLWEPTRSRTKAIVSLPRRARAPVSVHLSRPPKEIAAAMGVSGCIAILIDPEVPVASSVVNIQLALHLTLTEAKVALLVSGHGGIEAAIEELGISHQTVRTHLRNIYAKLGIHRQAELATAVASISYRVPH